MPRKTNAQKAVILADSRKRSKEEQHDQWDQELASTVEANWHGVFDLRQQKFLVAYAHVGIIQRACEYAEIQRRTFTNWMEKDVNFPLAFRACHREAVERLEDECRRRAEQGIVRTTPIYFQGRKVGERVERIYSDLLLMFLLKGLKPEMYREKFEAVSSDEAMQLAEASLTDEQLERIRSAVLDAGSDLSGGA